MCKPRLLRYLVSKLNFFSQIDLTLVGHILRKVRCVCYGGESHAVS